MIKTVGYTKAFLILALAIFSGLCAFYIYMKAQPDLKTVERNLQGANGQILQMQTDMDDLAKGFAQFEEEKLDYAKLQNLGFFNDQDRSKTKNIIEEMQRESRLLSARYSLSPARRLDEDRARDAGYDLVSTDINFTLDAIEDADIYRFVYLLNYGFPGQVKITSLSIKKNQDVTQPLLRQIGIGQAEPLITATLKASWRTMIPQGQMPSENNNE